LEVVMAAQAGVTPTAPLALHALIVQQAQRLDAAGLAFGQGTQTAFDEAAWLTLWALGLPLDTCLDDPVVEPEVADFSERNRPLSLENIDQVASLIDKRIATRQPAAYLTQEAWLQGVPFYVDERVIIPRSLIAEPLADGSMDVWLSDATQTVLDLCTGNGSLAVLAAMAWPEVQVTASDLSADALDVARINVQRHGLSERIRLVQSNGLAALAGQRFDLILCNPPYVNADSMAALPPEFQAEPALALSGNAQGGSDGMDFIRPLLAQVAHHLNEQGVLVLEIGHERPHFEAAFPHLNPVWLDTSAGTEQVLLLTRDVLLVS
jgi:ribosomal protein L3 glutamine methyltransferase